MKLITANLHDFALRYVTVSSEPVALLSNPRSGPKETGSLWCLLAYQSASWLLGSLSILTTCYRVHTGFLAPLSSSHPTLSPKLHLTGFPSPFHIYRTLPV